MKDLQEGVRRRLAPLDEIGALEWIEPLSAEDEITGERLARACDTLLSWDLWQRLVERGYQPGLPEPGSPTCLRVIFVVDRITGKSDNPPLGVVKAARELLKGRADLTSVMVWLGSKPEPPSEDLNLYWPRIRMEPVAAGGIAVDPQQVLEATEHLLVALVGSELIQVVNRMVNEEAEWLVMGASALLLHPSIEEWLCEAVLREVLGPLVAPLSEAEIDRIEKEISGHARKVREAMLEEALAALKETGWKIQTENLTIRQCILQQGALLEALFGPYRGGIITERPNVRDWKNWPRQLLTLISALAEPFLPDQSLGGTLYRHYQESRERMEQWLSIDKWRGLAPQVLEEYRRLSVLLGAFLDRGLISQVSPEKRPWFMKQPLPTGLPATLIALSALEKHLCEEGDIGDGRRPAHEWVRPEPVSDESYLRAAGDTDAVIVQGNLLRYAHFARTLVSPWGVLLYLLPAWPLAAFLVQLVAHWEPAQAILATGLGLLVIGIAELIYWWLLKARRLLKTVQQEAYDYLTSRILRLIARTIRDYRYWMLGQLREAEFALADLYGACLQRYAETEKAARALDEIRPRATGNTYTLVDRDKIQKWKEGARGALLQYPEWRKRAGEALRLRYPERSGEAEVQFDSAVTALLVREVWPLPEHPMPSGVVLKELESACAEVVRESAPKGRGGVWTASVAAEGVDLLKDGKRWEWLWQRAHPLGSAQPAGVAFTVITGPEALFSGPTGRGSPYWQQDWQIAPTFRSHEEPEEMCFRGIVERKRGG